MRVSSAGSLASVATVALRDRVLELLLLLLRVFRPALGLVAGVSLSLVLLAAALRLLVR